MSDFFEIDFHDVETGKSGDAISARYRIGDREYIHITDGGYVDVGERLLATVKAYYGNPDTIDFVVLTHPDGDHAAGLKHVLEQATVGSLWMHRPWLYADELLDRFPTYNSVDRLRSKLRSCFPNSAALEEIAEKRNIPIYEAFQGTQIGAFTVLAPSKQRYLDLVVESQKTPDGVVVEAASSALDWMTKAAKAAVNFIKAAWGEETFSTQETSTENEMSVIQFAEIDGKRILLTGDAGRKALAEAADYIALMGVNLPGIDRFQVPHHGSRRNVSSELLNRWLGPVLESPAASHHFTGIISSAKADEHHPRKSVIRAIQHRGGKVITTEGKSLRTFSPGAPARDGWVAVPGEPYPEEQEEI